VRLRRRSLTRSAGGGDAAAFSVVYERHHQALYRYCRSILRHDQDAQDALQSTMTRAFAALQDEPRDFELRPWLFGIAHNEAISLLRRRRPVDELDDLATRDAPVDEQVSLRADLQRLHQDLGALPERQRATLVLRELSGLSHTEIAQVLGITASSVKQSIYEARTGLLHAREGHEMHCDDVRRALSDGDGRVLRGTRMRAHLRSCSACRRFEQELVQRPRELAMLAPPLPIAAGTALLGQLLPASGAATTGMLSAFASAGTTSALAPKVVAIVAVIAAAGGGTAAVRHSAPTPPAQRQSDLHPTASPSPPRPSSTVVATGAAVARAPGLPAKTTPLPVAPKPVKGRKSANSHRQTRSRSGANARGRLRKQARATNRAQARGASERASRPRAAEKARSTGAAPAGSARPNPRSATAKTRDKRGGSPAPRNGG
jgi:RNA polymerase sigma factor (sigma-70 family)